MRLLERALFRFTKAVDKEELMDVIDGVLDQKGLVSLGGQFRTVWDHKGRKLIPEDMGIKEVPASWWYSVVNEQ